MAKSVIITNGTGTSNLINDTYSVTASVTGYENTSIDPTSISVVEGTNTYAFTISATGTLTLHVSEDGTSTGTPIVGATFVSTDSSGTEYGRLCRKRPADPESRGQRTARRRTRHRRAAHYRCVGIRHRN